MEYSLCSKITDEMCTCLCKVCMHLHVLIGVTATGKEIERP